MCTHDSSISVMTMDPVHTKTITNNKSSSNLSNVDVLKKSSINKKIKRA